MFNLITISYFLNHISWYFLFFDCNERMPVPIPVIKLHSHLPKSNLVALTEDEAPQLVDNCTEINTRSTPAKRISSNESISANEMLVRGKQSVIWESSTLSDLPVKGGNKIPKEVESISNSLMKELTRTKRQVRLLKNVNSKSTKSPQVIPATAKPPAAKLISLSTALSPAPKASRDLCNLSILIQTLVDEILHFVHNFLKGLLLLIVNLLGDIIHSVVRNLLPQMLKTQEQLLGTLLMDISKNKNLLFQHKYEVVIGLIQNTTGSFRLHKSSFNTVEFKTGFSSSLNDTIPIMKNVLKGLFVMSTKMPKTTTTSKITTSRGPRQKCQKVQQKCLNKNVLFNKVSIKVNNTFDNLSNDVKTMANNLLTNSLGNSSVTKGLTKDVMTLLKDILGDTVCNVEKLVKNSQSLSKLNQNLLQLIKNLLNDILKDIHKLLVDGFKKILTNKSFLDKLLNSIFKLVTDALIDLFTPYLNKLKDSLPNNDPKGLIVRPLHNFLDNLIHISKDVIKKLEDMITNRNSRLFKSFLNSTGSLINNLSNDLGQKVPESLNPKLSQLIDPSSMLGPLSTLITNILKQVVCVSCKKFPAKPPVTTKISVVSRPPITIKSPVTFKTLATSKSPVTSGPSVTPEQKLQDSDNVENFLEPFGTFVTNILRNVFDFFHEIIQSPVTPVTSKPRCLCHKLIDCKQKCNCRNSN